MQREYIRRLLSNEQETNSIRIPNIVYRYNFCRDLFIEQKNSDFIFAKKINEPQ